MPSGSTSTAPSGSFSNKAWTLEEHMMVTLQHNDADKKRSVDHKDDSLPPPVQLQSSFHDPERRGRRKSRLPRPVKKFWRSVREHLGGDDVASTIATTISNSRELSIEREQVGVENFAADGNAVDAVVVDRDWGVDAEKKFSSADDRSPDQKSSSSPPYTVPMISDGVEDIISRYDSPPWWLRGWPWTYHQLWKVFVHPPPNMHADLEEKYRAEDWKKSKRLALWASSWYILNWALGVIAALPRDLPDKIFHYGVAPAFSVPLFFIVMYDMPTKWPILYQCFLTFSTWMWPFYYVLYMFLCGFYDRQSAIFTCGEGKDFQAIFYYTVALQTISLFGLKLKRSAAAFGALVFFVFSFAAIVPDRSVWWRSLINFAVYHYFLLFIHYRRECGDRKLYQTQDELQLQNRKRQKAQEMERRASDSKHLLASYVFHEVRVPLNTAVLAAQNMEANGNLTKDDEMEFHALKSSLSMMTQVLNDVLDFNRMDRGLFEIVNKPFPFHKTIRSLYGPLQLAAESNKLHFNMKLDPNIDKVARIAAYKAMGQTDQAIEKQIGAYPDVSGVVVGDESRLRQIVTNFASNACKFTPKDGTINITTQLVHPKVNEDGTFEDEDAVPNGGHETPVLSASHLRQLNGENQEDKPPGKVIVVRIEVQDTGCGIAADELQNSKLFSAFNQTHRGKEQGGTGSGLGLALVRNIVIHSHARLGVKSVHGSGSTFWVELPFKVGMPTLPATPHVSALSEDEGTGSAPSKAETIKVHAEGIARAAAMQLKTPLMQQANAATRPASEHRHSPHPSLHSTVSTPQTGISDPFSSMFSPPQAASTGSRRNSLSSVRESSFVSSKPRISGDPMITYDQTFDVASADQSPGELPQNMSVLVVDDDVLTRKLMTKMLTRLGQHVTLAENGQIAVQLILGPDWAPEETGSGTGAGSVRFVKQLTESPVRPTFSRRTTGLSGGTAGTTGSAGSPGSGNPGSPVSYSASRTGYDLVFMDNQMPVMSGLVAVKNLREMGRTEFIVGLTGNALKPDQDEFLQAGVDAVLTKPVWEPSIKEMLMKAQAHRIRKARQSPS